MDSRYIQPTFYDEAVGVDATDLFPAAQSMSTDCLSDDIASYFSFDDTTINSSGATTPSYYPSPSPHDNDAANIAEGDDEPRQSKAAQTKAEHKKSSGGNSKPKRKYSASVTDEAAEAAVVVAAAPAVVNTGAVETKASKRAKKLAQIDVAAAVSTPASPFSLSPSFSSGSVSPDPSFSSANSSTPFHAITST